MRKIKSSNDQSKANHTRCIKHINVQYAPKLCNVDVQPEIIMSLKSELFGFDRNEQKIWLRKKTFNFSIAATTLWVRRKQFSVLFAHPCVFHQLRTCSPPLCNRFHRQILERWIIFRTKTATMCLRFMPTKPCAVSHRTPASNPFCAHRWCHRWGVLSPNI